MLLPHEHRSRHSTAPPLAAHRLARLRHGIKIGMLGDEDAGTLAEQLQRTDDACLRMGPPGDATAATQNPAL